MVKNVRILDCTLRDGGRIINCAFGNQEITDLRMPKLILLKLDSYEMEE